MAIITFQFDTGTVPISKITDAFGLTYNYQSKLPDGTTNPETPTLFARRMVKEYVTNIVKAQDTKTAVATAQATVTPITLT